jgi:Lon protease-like protein
MILLFMPINSNSFLLTDQCPTEIINSLPSLKQRQLLKASTTRIMMTKESPDDSSSSSSFMASLSSRLKEIKDKETKLPLVVLDSMLPLQVFEIQVKNTLFINLVRDCLRRESPYFGMLGMARLSSGQQIHLSRGVEVQILQDKLQFLPDNEGIKLSLRGGRRFKIEGEVENADGGWTEARVQFLDSAEEEEDEILSSGDPMTLARAIAKCREFTSPNMNMPNNLSLVDRWVELAKENERQNGQIDKLLDDLGEIPPPERPSERAFWIGALINPLPAMGVALEIRPALLSAKTAEERVHISLDGIFRSIKHMDGSARLW